MNRIMKPKAIAVIGASNEEGKIGNSVMKNLINGGYQGKIFPINPKSDTVLDLPAYKAITDVPEDVDVAVFAVPAKFVAAALEQCGEKGVAGAILIPSGFAETGNQELQDEVVAIARKYGVRLLGPNIYGYYYTPENLCATFCTPYDVKGSVALSSQSGGIGMAILGFSRSSNMGVSAIVGVGNKSDIDEDDLLTFFEADDNTQLIAMHLEDLKDGRAFAETASRVSKEKPVVVLKAGRTDMGARAASSHTGALAGNDKVYDDILRQSGVIRAPGLNDMLQYARGVPLLPTPKGENVVIITGAGGSGVLLSDAVVDNGMTLMDIPDDLAAQFDEYIPPFGASGNPVDITGGEPPSTYRNTIALGLEDDRIHALILGYWHTIVTPPMVFAELVVGGGGGVPRQGHQQARGRLPCRRRRGREGQRVPLRPRCRGLSLHHRAAGRRTRGEVPVGPQRRGARRLRTVETVNGDLSAGGAPEWPDFLRAGGHGSLRHTLCRASCGRVTEEQRGSPQQSNSSDVFRWRRIRRHCLGRRKLDIRGSREATHLLLLRKSGKPVGWTRCPSGSCQKPHHRSISLVRPCSCSRWAWAWARPSCGRAWSWSSDRTSGGSS